MMRALPAIALPAMLLGATGAMATGLSVDTPMGDHAVLQRQRAITIAGDAAPSSTVTVGFNTATLETRADANGRWRVDLPAQAAGGPYTMDVKSQDQRLHFADVMVGDVWLCSGQSNMEFTLVHATNSYAEVNGAGNPMIHLLNVPRAAAPAPRDNFAAPTPWQVAAPGTAADFSAACFIMGRELQAQTHLPVGLISASYGGSMIEAWIGRDALGKVLRFQSQLSLLDRYAHDPAGAASDWTQGVTTWLGARAAPPAHAVWRKVPTPITFWEASGGPDFANFDGIGYYRTHVVLKPGQTGKASLTIGAVDDMDVTRINGQVLGATAGWNEPRRYAVPAGVLHAGDNVIDVVAIDLGAGGGMHGDGPRAIALSDGSEVPLTDWDLAQGAPLAQIGTPGSPPWDGPSGKTTIYNAMIAPLHGWPLQGIAWYQGESNVGAAKAYASLLRMLVKDWRQRFGVQPFIETELARFGPLTSEPSDDAWAQLRAAQREVADGDAMVGLASALDVGQVGDIHPTDKQTVGHRLALAARHLALGEAVEDRGPSVQSVVRSANGIAVTFAQGPLRLVGGGEALGFEECDDQNHCHFVPGKLAGDVLILPDDAQARSVRYLWQASPIVNLYNRAGLPASGFAMAIRSGT